MHTDEERVERIRRWSRIQADMEDVAAKNHISSGESKNEKQLREDIDLLLSLLDQYRDQFELLDDPQGLYSEAREKIVEACAVLAEQAQLPNGFQWGHDAIEQFNFGKEQAAKAIRTGKADRKQ